MSWATVAGLVVIFAIVGAFSRLWLEWSKECARREIEERIRKIDAQLVKAIDEQPDNKSEHQRLRLELERLYEALTEL